MDTTGRIELEERCGASDVSGVGIVDWRGCEKLCAVVLNIDDVCSGVIVGNKCKFLLNAAIHKEGSGLPMGIRELV